MTFAPSRLQLLLRPLTRLSSPRGIRRIVRQGGECRVEYRPHFGISHSRPFSSSSDDAVPAKDLELAQNAVDQQSVDVIPGSQTGGRKMAIVFTCKVCNTRSAKQFTEQAYNHGVVIVKCPECLNQHLIADRLGFFEDDSWDIETAMKASGEKFTTVTNDNVLEVTMKDILGDKYDEALQVVGHDLPVQVSGDDETMTKQENMDRFTGKHNPW